MSTLAVNQPFFPDSAEEIRDDLLTDFRLEAIKYSVVEPAITPGTDNYLFFTAVANSGMLQYAGIATIRPALTPLFATGDDLENWRKALKLPEVTAGPSTGKITVTVLGGASVTIVAGTQFLLPNGLRGKVATTKVGVTDQSDVDVVALDTGSKTNASAGTKVRWSGSVPFNVAAEAKVSVNGPLTGGTDQETEARKRERVLNKLGNDPGGGNWGQLRQIALDTLPAVQNAFVFPAPGGPASEKLTVVKAFDRGINDYHRAMADSAVALIRDAVFAEMPDGIEKVVGTADETTTNISLKLTIPDSTLAGGDGSGWTDQIVWPLLSGGDTRIEVTGVTSSTEFTVAITDTTAPVTGQTRVAWWSPSDMRFRTALVVAATPSSGHYALVVDTPLVDSTGTKIAIGDYISPPSANQDKYGSFYLDQLEALGTGELTADANRLPRARRHPYTNVSSPSDITNNLLGAFTKNFAEVTDAAFGITSATTPGVPTTVSSNPKILVPQHFGIYKQ